MNTRRPECIQRTLSKSLAGITRTSLQPHCVAVDLEPLKVREPEGGARFVVVLHGRPRIFMVDAPLWRGRSGVNTSLITSVVMSGTSPPSYRPMPCRHSALCNHREVLMHNPG